MTKHDGNTDEPVGYGKPPVANRFKKGASGNPKGRPRKPIGQQRDELAELMFGINKVSNGGKKTAVRRVDVVLDSLKKKALSGDYKTAAQLLEDHRRQQQRHAPARRYPTMPHVFTVPYAPHEIVEWSDIYGDIARDGLVPADPWGQCMVTPEWLEQELKRQEPCGVKAAPSEMDQAIARVFNTKVLVNQCGVESRIFLSKALSLVLTNAAKDSPAALRTVNKMLEGTGLHAVGDPDLDNEKHGYLIVPYAPDTIAEWVELYGADARGETAAEMEREFQHQKARDLLQPRPRTT